MAPEGDAPTPPVEKPKRPPRKRRAKVLAIPDPPLPPDDDPLVLARQLTIYNLRVAGSSIAAISTHIGQSRLETYADLRAEMQRRRKEFSKVRIDNVALAIARYEQVIARANTRIQDMKTSKAGMRFAFLEEKVIMDAQKRIDALLGLVAPVIRGAEGDDDFGSGGSPTQPVAAITLLLQLPPEQRAIAMSQAHARRIERRTEMKDVTPPKAS